MYNDHSVAQMIERGKAVQTLNKLGIKVLEITNDDAWEWCHNKKQATQIKNIALAIHRECHDRIMWDAQVRYWKRVDKNKRRAKRKA